MKSYSLGFLVSAASAAAPGEVQVELKYEAAKVSVQV